MKHMITGAVLFLASIAPAMAEMSTAQFCAKLGYMGELAVEDSQRGGSVDSLIAVVNNQYYSNPRDREMVKQILISAYEIPIRHSKKHQERAAKAYQYEVESRCNRDYDK